MIRQISMSAISPFLSIMSSAIEIRNFFRLSFLRFHLDSKGGVSEAFPVGSGRLGPISSSTP